MSENPVKRKKLCKICWKNTCCIYSIAKYVVTLLLA